MTSENNFDVVIVGGSYSGLAAGMALGRALRKVLIIDNGKPCNRQTPHSHNFLTNDGRTPDEIAVLARQQVSNYDTVRFFRGTASATFKTETGYKIQVTSGETFAAKKLIFATGIKDVLPPIEGIAECWGISVLHCPYCHGYEVRNEKTGILCNGETVFDFVMLVFNWTKNLLLFTNGISLFTDEQRAQIQHHQIKIIEKEIEWLEHDGGQVQNVIFKDGSKAPIKTIYAPGPFEQHCKIPEKLGCELSEEGYIKIDSFMETSVKGIYAVGDNASVIRTVASAVAMGTTAGITISKNMILNEFSEHLLLLS